MKTFHQINANNNASLNNYVYKVVLSLHQRKTFISISISEHNTQKLCIEFLYRIDSKIQKEKNGKIVLSQNS